LRHDPLAREYSDLALTPVVSDEFDSYKIFSNTEAAKTAVAKVRHPSQFPVGGKTVLVAIEQQPLPVPPYAR
jgi:hypothetical protein